MSKQQEGGWGLGEEELRCPYVVVYGSISVYALTTLCSSTYLYVRTIRRHGTVRSETQRARGRKSDDLFKSKSS